MACALYIHIPFCVKKCAYCDFVSFAGRTRDVARYLHALELEMDATQKREGRLHVESVYLGGGTPTLLSGEQVCDLLCAARRAFDIAPHAEISMEGNPGTLRADNLRAYRTAGVNRLSLGVQSLDDALLRALGRVHSREDAFRAVRMAREAGFDDINLDLIYGLPDQTMDIWLDTLKAALELCPTHLSLYSLIVEEGTPLCARVAAGACRLPEEERVLAMQHGAARELRRHGYARYEISNYARPGRECRHNLVYWTRGDYLGIGCAAHSLLHGDRFANSDSLDEYLETPAALRPRSHISPREAFEEAVMLALRTVHGIELNEFAARYGVDLRVTREDVIARLIAHDYAHITSDRLYLTARGMDVQNAVVLALI